MFLYIPKVNVILFQYDNGLNIITVWMITFWRLNNQTMNFYIEYCILNKIKIRQQSFLTKKIFLKKYRVFISSKMKATIDSEKDLWKYTFPVFLLFLNSPLLNRWSVSLDSLPLLFYTSGNNDVHCLLCKPPETSIEYVKIKVKYWKYLWMVKTSKE